MLLYILFFFLSPEDFFPRMPFLGASGLLGPYLSDAGPSRKLNKVHCRGGLHVSRRMQYVRAFVGSNVLQLH